MDRYDAMMGTVAEMRLQQAGEDASPAAAWLEGHPGANSKKEGEVIFVKKGGTAKAKPFVPLWTVGWHVKEIALLSPNNI